MARLLCARCRPGMPGGAESETSDHHESLVFPRETKAKVRRGHPRISPPNHALLPQRPGSRKVRHGRAQEFCSGPCLTLPRLPGPPSKARPGAGIRRRPCLTLAFVLQWKSAFARFVPGIAREPRPAQAAPEVRRGHAQLFSARDHGALGVHPVPAWDAGQRRKRN